VAELRVDRGVSEIAGTAPVRYLWAAEARVRRARIVFRSAVAAAALMSRISVLPPAAALLPSSAASAAEGGDSCVSCHGDPDFLVTNRKLYDYFQEWNASVHKQEEVSCSDCHGGNPEVADKDGAHGGKLAGAEATSAVNFRNIARTCGECHGEMYEAFRQSEHFEHLLGKKEEQKGPNCVTCHGSINVEALSVVIVTKACARCHNDETENQPEIPAKAEALLNSFLSIHRFYRYIGVKGDPADSREFFETVDPRIYDLAVNWHTFDLEKIEEKTDWVLLVIKVKRDAVRAEMRARRAERERR
jgi:hypothetical protein